MWFGVVCLYSFIHRAWIAKDCPTSDEEPNRKWFILRTISDRKNRRSGNTFRSGRGRREGLCLRFRDRNEYDILDFCRLYLTN